MKAREATISEIKSLDEIVYKSKVKLLLTIILVLFVFVTAFFNSYPVGDKIKTQIRAVLKNSGCNPDFRDIRMEFLLPKIVIDDLSLPASCLGKDGAPLNFNFVKINWHVISFSPFGIPFRVDTELSGKPISVYFVQGLGQQMVRLKDQKLVLPTLEPFLGKFKMGGSAIVDMSMLMDKAGMKEFSLKAQSHDFVIPGQDIEGFPLPSLKVNDFYLEAGADAPSKVNVTKLIIGDPNAPVRANFKGRVDLVRGNTGMSPLNLSGEVAFSETLRKQLSWLEMMFESFPQKDGFYQIRLGGTLSSPQRMAP